MNVRAHHRAQAPGAGAGRGARLLHRGQKALERALLAKEQDLVLAAEVVVQVAGRKIGFLGDLAHAGRRETQAAEYARGRAQDLQAPRVVLALDALRQGALVRTAIQNLNHCSNSKPLRSRRQLPPKLEALDLAGRRLGQFVHELDPARVLIRREPVLDVLLHGRFEGFARGAALLEHDERFGLDQPVAVLVADHRGFEHRLVADERGLDLCGRDVEAGDSQHVVGAAGVDKVTVLVLPELVAAPEPRADKGRSAFLAVVPVIRRTRRSAHLELADLAPLYRSPLLVYQAQLVTGHGLPGRAVAHISRPGTDEHVQHLGRTDALQDVDTGPIFQTPAHVGGQGLAGRDA